MGLGEQGINLPGTPIDLPALTEKDKKDLVFGVQQGVDLIAASFIRKADDVKDIRKVCAMLSCIASLCWCLCSVSALCVCVCSVVEVASRRSVRVCVGGVL